MRKILTKLHSKLLEKHDLCLATIINKQGSAPRSFGTSLLIQSNHSIIGTIGGGLLEKKVIKEALNVLKNNKTKLLNFNLNNKNISKNDMICGGNLSVYLEPILSNDKTAISFFKKTAFLIKKNKNFLIITKILPSAKNKIINRKILISRNNQHEKSSINFLNLKNLLKNILKQKTKKNNTILFEYRPLLKEKKQILIQSITSFPHIYIFGGGHIGLSVATLAKFLGFKIIIIDDKKEFANFQRFPMADEIYIENFKKILSNINISNNSYIIIVTRGHSYDEQVLSQTLLIPSFYLGMIGSKNKIKMIYNHLEKKGFSKQDLSRVHAPIGLNIKAQTPEEIAISIVAEIVSIRNNQH